MSQIAKNIVPLKPTTEHTPAHAHRNEKILLVNNQQDTLPLLNNLLIEAGFTDVSLCRDALTAISHLKKHSFDLIITDLQLPDISGCRLARMVRSGVFKCPENLPIIATSETHSPESAAITAKENEINHFQKISKNSGPALLSLVHECFNPPINQQKPTLLIIEDDPDTAYLAQKMLRGQFDIEIACEGESGISSWRRSRHDLILLDVMMPKVSGYEVLTAIIKEHPQQPVIIMTADGTMERSEKMMLAGAADFISKPFRAEKLRQICNIALRTIHDTAPQQPSDQNEPLTEHIEKQTKISTGHQRLLDNISSVIFEISPTGQLQLVNKAWEVLTLAEVENSVGSKLVDFIHPIDRSNFTQALANLTNGDSTEYNLELRIINKNGSPVWVKLTLQMSSDQTPDNQVIYGRIEDISEKKQAHEQLEYMAAHDSLTGLHNRTYFERALEKVATSCLNSQATHSLLYIDLDHFKVVNDTFSPKFGDIILKAVSDLLKSRTRDHDTLCRIGSDEFALLLNHTSLDKTIAVAEDILNLFNNHQYKNNNFEFTISGSIGVSMIDGSRQQPSEYFVQANKASFVAKNNGRNQVQIYDPQNQISQALKQSVNWSQRLNQAIEKDQLALFLQPILELQTHQIKHHEVLLRLFSEEDGLFSLPPNFISSLEKEKNIPILDRWVIDNTLKQIADKDAIHHVAINLSGCTLQDTTIYNYIEQKLNEYQVAPEIIIFEITETTNLTNTQETGSMINSLRKLGCQFALDDFGTGFCSFNYLKHLPVDYLKLDGSYIQSIAHNDLDLAMVQSMNDIAHTLGKKTIAECVEEPDTLEKLREIGVDYVQGHIIGKPRPILEALTP